MKHTSIGETNGGLCCESPRCEKDGMIPMVIHREGSDVERLTDSQKASVWSAWVVRKKKGKKVAKGTRSN